jgi:hypothetical protein
MEASMRFTKLGWLPVVALLGVSTAVVGLVRSESATPLIKIWDAAFYDSEGCRPGPDVEIACPDYTMRIQGKAFTADIQSECDSQIEDTGIRKCTIAVDMKSFRDERGLHDPSVHHHKSMWIDYECNPGAVGSKRIRVFGEEATDTHPDSHIALACN